MKKPIYSAKPGNYPLYLGKPKTLKNRDRYGSIEESEERRVEMKEELRERMIIKKTVNYFKEQTEIENSRLCEKLINNQIKKIDNHE